MPSSYVPSDKIDGLVTEITKLVDQFKSYEKIASEVLEATNDLIDSIDENTLLGTKHSGTGNNRSNQADTDDAPFNLFNESVNIFSSSVSAFNTAVQNFITGVSKGGGVQQSQPVAPTQQQAVAASGGGGGIDFSKILKVAGIGAAGYLGIKAVGAIGNMLGGLLGGGGGSSGGGGGGILGQIFAMEQAAVNLRKQFHFSDAAVQSVAISLQEASIATRLWGVDAADVGKELEKLTDATGRVRFFSVEDFKTMGAAKAVMGEDAVNFFDNFDKMGISISGAKNMFQEMRKTSGEFGVDAAKHAKTVHQNLGRANQFHFRNGINGLSRMVALSMRMRMDFDQITTYANKFQDFDSAISTSANMQLLGGPFAANANPFQNMYDSLMDPEAIVKKHADMGKQLMTWNTKTGGFEANSLDARLRIREYATQTGLDPAKLMETMRRGASEGMIAAELGRNQNNLTKDQQNLVKGKADWDADKGAWTVAVRDAATNTTTNKRVDQLTAKDMEFLQADSETHLYDIATNTRTLAQQVGGILNSLKGWGVNFLAKLLPEGAYGKASDMTGWGVKIMESLPGKETKEQLGILGDAGKEAFDTVGNVVSETWSWITDTAFPQIGETINNGWEKIKEWLGIEDKWNMFMDNWVNPIKKEIVEMAITIKEKAIAIYNSVKSFFKWATITMTAYYAAKGVNALSGGRIGRGLGRGVGKVVQRVGARIAGGKMVGGKLLLKAGAGKGVAGMVGKAGVGLGGKILAGVGMAALAKPLLIAGAVGAIGYGAYRLIKRRKNKKEEEKKKNAEVEQQVIEEGEGGDGNATNIKTNSVNINSDNVTTAKSDSALSQLILKTAEAKSLRESNANNNLSHSGKIDINLGGTIQLQDPNGNVYNWDKITNNQQFISQLTDKISMEITKKQNFSSAGDGRIMYGGALQMG